MAGFDFFTQPSIPNIDVQLFGQAAVTGAQLGQAIPSPATSIIQGLTSGVKQGMQMGGQLIAAKQAGQQIQMNEEKLKQAPLQTEILEQQAKAAPYKEMAAEAVSQVQAAQAGEALELQKQFDTFNADWQNADPLTRKNMIFDPQYTSLFATNPHLYNQAVSSVGQFMSPAELQSAQLASAKYGVSSAYDARMQREAQKAGMLEDNAVNDFYIKQAAQNSGLSPLEVPSKVEAVPSGYYSYDPVTREIIPDNDTGKPKTDEANIKPNMWDYKYGNKIIASGVPKDSYKNFVDYRDNVSWRNGTHLNSALKSVQDSLGPQAQQPAPSPEGRIGAPATQENIYEEPPAPTAEGGVPPPVSLKTVNPNPAAVMQTRQIPMSVNGQKVPLSNNRMAYQVTQSTLGLPEMQFKEAKPMVKEFLSQTEEPPSGWFGMYSSEQIQAQTRTKDKIASFSAEVEWNTDEATRKEYTPEKVAQHNQLVRQFKAALKTSMSPAESAGQALFNMVFPSSSATMDTMEEVATPKDLYILNRRGYFIKSLDNLFSNFQNQVNASKIAALKSGQRGDRVLSVLSR